MCRLPSKTDANEGGVLTWCKVPAAISPEAKLIRNDQIIKGTRRATDSNAAWKGADYMAKSQGTQIWRIPSLGSKSQLGDGNLKYTRCCWILNVYKGLACFCTLYRSLGRHEFEPSLSVQTMQFLLSRTNDGIKCCPGKESLSVATPRPRRSTRCPSERSRVRPVKPVTHQCDSPLRACRAVQITPCLAKWLPPLLNVWQAAEGKFLWRHKAFLGRLHRFNASATQGNSSHFYFFWRKPFSW